MSELETDLAKYISKLSAEDVIHEGCKVCTSPLRVEAEAMFQIGKNIHRIYLWLKDRHEKDKLKIISYRDVSIHLNGHFKLRQSEDDLKMYVSQLRRWGEVSSSDQELLSRMIAQLDMEATWLAANNVHCDLNDRRKSDETIIKMMELIASLKEKLRELNSEFHPVEVMVKSLNKVIEIELKKGHSDETKDTLKHVIEQLQNQMKDISVEGLPEK